MVDNLCFWYCIEIFLVCNEGTDTLSEFTDLDADIPQEGAALPLSHYHNFSEYTLAIKSSIANLGLR